VSRWLSLSLSLLQQSTFLQSIALRELARELVTASAEAVARAQQIRGRSVDMRVECDAFLATCQSERAARIAHRVAVPVPP
jgi:uncharacterized protein (DUF2384 family)